MKYSMKLTRLALVMASPALIVGCGEVVDDSAANEPPTTVERNEIPKSLEGYEILTERQCEEFRNLEEIKNARIEDDDERNRCAAEFMGLSESRTGDLYEGSVGFKSSIVDLEELQKAGENLANFDYGTEKANVVILKSDGQTFSRDLDERNPGKKDGNNVVVFFYPDSDDPQGATIMVDKATSETFRKIDELVERSANADE